MLRASHRAITRSLSAKTSTGRIYRPWRPHTNPTLVTPGDAVDYLIEIFPVGHVLRKGHELVVKVHAPPLDDNDYMYVQKTAPAVNTLHVDPKHPSWLMLPVVPTSAVKSLGAAPKPCTYEQMRCIAS
jgi:predicted acyl esterase